MAKRGERLNLPVAAIEEMKRRYDRGESIPDLAISYNAHPRTIRRYVCPTIKRVKSEGIKQTYRENINWALSTAGEFLRTEVEPETCPNDAAFFLYQQAIDDPKDFMAKVAAIEKSAEDSADNTVKVSTKKTLSEIESFLERLEENGQDHVCKQG